MSELRWSQFAVAAPALAAEARRLFTSHGVTLGFVATVRADGGPRVHPVCPLFHEQLHLFVVPGPKQEDLRRDGRYALHCETYPPPTHEDAAYVTGTAVEIRDPATFALAVVLLLASVVGAAAGPALRAARTDPISALRTDV